MADLEGACLGAAEEVVSEVARRLRLPLATSAPPTPPLLLLLATVVDAAVLVVVVEVVVVGQAMAARNWCILARVESRCTAIAARC